jgi:hypothetical protein
MLNKNFGKNYMKNKYKSSAKSVLIKSKTKRVFSKIKKKLQLLIAEMSAKIKINYQ